jgi:hypothetical protein
MEFDPYHRWLAIPKGQRPPTYYQLLGLATDERDAEVIEEAALRQTSHVRTYQTGPYAEQCLAILNEIGQARVTLLNPDKRREYDARIQGHLAPAALVPAQASLSADPPGRLPSPRRPLWAEAALWAYVALLVLGAALAFAIASLPSWPDPPSAAPTREQPR